MAAATAKAKSSAIRISRMTEALDSRDQYTFFVPPDARWNSIRHLKEDVGAGVFVTGFVTRGSGLVLGALFGRADRMRSSPTASSPSPALRRHHARQRPRQGRQIKGWRKLRRACGRELGDSSPISSLFTL